VALTSRVPDKPTFEEVWPEIAGLAPAELSRLSPGAGYDRRRYRPNIVLRVPGTGFVENAWVGEALRAGGLELPA